MFVRLHLKGTWTDRTLSLLGRKQVKPVDQRQPTRQLCLVSLDVVRRLLLLPACLFFFLVFNSNSFHLSVVA